MPPICVVDEGDEVLVDLAYDLHGECVRDAEAVAELRLDADVEQPGVDLRPSAMDEHEAETEAGGRGRERGSVAWYFAEQGG